MNYILKVLGLNKECSLKLKNEKSLADIIYNNKARKRALRYKVTGWIN